MLKRPPTSDASDRSACDCQLERDWGLLYGVGLFETMRVYDGEAFLLDEHLERMFSSAIELGLQSLPNRRDLACAVSAYCREFRERVVRVTLTGGNPDHDLPPRVVLADRPLPAMVDRRHSGLDVMIAASPRERSVVTRHKTLNQLQNIMAWRDAANRGCQETLFFNRNGVLAEGSRTNVFIVSDSKVVTPAECCGILPGIARHWVMQLLRAAGIAVHDGQIDRETLLAADECFVTNSAIEVVAVRSVEHHRIGQGRPGPLTQFASGLYRSAVVARMRRH